MPRGVRKVAAGDPVATDAADVPVAAVNPLPPVKMVAATMGFYNGAMVKPGQSFMFDPNPSKPGAVVKPPKWAAPPGEKAEKQPPAVMPPFDTRPAAAVAASKLKAGALSGDK